MAELRRSALAEQDYRDIWRYIAADNPGAADRFARLQSRGEQNAVTIKHTRRQSVDPFSTEPRRTFVLACACAS
jgi:plasmid stabilization system protein ParE